MGLEWEVGCGEFLGWEEGMKLQIFHFVEIDQKDRKKTNKKYSDPRKTLPIVHSFLH